MANESVGKPATLQTAQRALKFLEVVASSTPPPRVREVAERLNVNLTSAYHLFNTLHQSGYVTREHDGTIRLGPQIGVLYEGFRRQFSPTRDLLPFVEQLSNTTRETAYLSLLQREGLVVQLQIEAEQALRVAGHGVGFAGHEHVRASGKAVMAYMEPDKCSQLLDRLLAAEPMPASAAIRDTLRKEFASIRAQGWALDHDEYQAGVCCVAAPFFGPDGAVTGSVSVSMPTGRYAEVRESITQAVLQCAQDVSRVHGHVNSDPSLAG